MAAVRLGVAATAASVLLYTGRTIVQGIALRETLGAAAKFNLRDGTTVAGPIVLPFNFVANESSRDWFGEEGIRFTTGIYLEMVAGTIEGALLVG